MPFCPECKYEYVAGIKACPDCYVDLVEALPEEKKAAYVDAELVCIASYPYDIEAQEARIKLQAFDIESLINTRMDVSGGMAMTDPGVRVMVRKEDAAKAIEVLEIK